MTRICVLGAGAVGLSTAVQLQERFPKLVITLIADKFNSDTLSSGAGGIFRVSPSVQGCRPQSVRYGLSAYFLIKMCVVKLFIL